MRPGSSVYCSISPGVLSITLSIFTANSQGRAFFLWCSIRQSWRYSWVSLFSFSLFVSLFSFAFLPSPPFVFFYSCTFMRRSWLALFKKVSICMCELDVGVVYSICGIWVRATEPPPLQLLTNVVFLVFVEWIRESKKRRISSPGFQFSLHLYLSSLWRRS